MAMARLRWVLVALSAFLPHLVTPYYLGAGCTPNVIRPLIDEAVYIASRASQVLAEVINQQTTSECHWAVENILSALVGTTAAGSIQTMTFIQSEWDGSLVEWFLVMSETS